MPKTFFYHESNYKHPYLVSEDSWSKNDDIFIVADGVTHDLDKNGIYPYESDSAKVSEIAARTALESLKLNSSFSESFDIANQKIMVFNKGRSLYENRENNGYSFGATLLAVCKIDGNKLDYAFLHDCFVQVYSKNSSPKIKIRPDVSDSLVYFESQYNWALEDHRKVWRKEIRNHKFVTKDGSFIGYGVLDGSAGFQGFIQSGTVKLKEGDIAVVATDGFIEPLADKNFLKLISNFESSKKRYDDISAYMRSKSVDKEKTAYFIYF